MLDKLASLLTNTIGEERTIEYGSVIGLLDSLGSNIMEDLNDLDSLESDTFSKESYVDLITEVIRKNVFLIYRGNKILLSEDELSTSDLKTLKGLVMAIITLQSLKDSNDVSTLFLINDVLESDGDSKVYDVSDSVSKIVYILNICSDVITLENYYKLIDKVYDELIVDIENILKYSLENMEPYGEIIISDNDNDEDIIKVFTLVNIIVNRLTTKGIKFVPQVLLDIVDDPLNISLFKNSSELTLKDKVKKINMGYNVSSNILDYVIISLIGDRDYSDIVDKVDESEKGLALKMIEFIRNDENDIVTTTLKKIKSIG